MNKPNPSPDLIDDENIIINLINTGFFDESKKYGDIIKNLKTKAKFNKKANYKTILIKLTRDDKLDRKQVHHQWEYVKK